MIAAKTVPKGAPPTDPGNLFFESNNGVFGTLDNSSDNARICETEFVYGLIGFIKCCDGALISEEVVQTSTDSEWYFCSDVEEEDDQVQSNATNEEVSMEVTEVFWGTEDDKDVFRMRCGSRSDEI